MKIVAFGLPAPQGSKSYKGQRAGKDGRSHAILAESSKKVKPWRKEVERAGTAAMNGAPPFDGPLRVRMVFTMPKPKSAPKTRRTWPDRMPDLSKLVRSTEDALKFNSETKRGVWMDDARVVECHAFKVFPNEHPESLAMPGVRIEIEVIA